MSDTADSLRASQEARPAARLGGELRAARQRLGWELPDLAGSLRIRLAYLEAIEAGRMGELPGTTYALGFVRTYASALGLSGEEVARRFRAEAEEVQQKPALRFPVPVPQRGVPAGALMLLGLVILVGAYGGWYYVSEHQHTLVETVPPIPDRMLPLAEKPGRSTPAPSPQVASILPNASPPSARLPSQDAAGSVTHTSPAATPDAPSPSSATLPQHSSAVVAGQPAPTSGSAAPAATVPPAAAPPPGAAATANPPGTAATANPGIPAVTPPPTALPTAALPPGVRVVVRTTADAWVTVKQKGGPALFNKLMHAGDTVPLPADKTGLTLTTGNAGGTELVVDGAPVESLGGSGMVRRDLPLDPNALKAGHFTPIGHGRTRIPAPAAPADAG